MNAIVNTSAYHTFHVTPESHCSYGSWETNAKVETYAKVLPEILRVFRPKKFTMTLYADWAGLDQLLDDPFDTRLDVEGGLHYQRACKCETHFEGDYACFVANYVRL